MSHKLGSFYNKIHKSLVQHYKEKKKHKVIDPYTSVSQNTQQEFSYFYSSQKAGSCRTISCFHEEGAAVFMLIESPISSEYNTVLLTICGFI